MNLSNTRHFKFHIEELNISIENIEKLARMGEGMPSYIEFLNKEINSTLLDASIEGGYIILDSDSKNDRIEVEGQVFQMGEAIAKHYTNCSQLAVFVCTAGPEVSKRSMELSQNGDLIEGFLVDILGSVIVEKAMDRIQKTLQEELLKNGLKATNRYSPGYVDWNVGEQQKLFSLLPNQFCNVSLSESSLMSPSKSVSGIIGIGKNAKYKHHVCNDCSSANCIYRNKRIKDPKNAENNCSFQ